MSTKTLSSLFQYKAWADRGLIDAMLAVAEDEHPMQMIRIRILLDHISVVDRLFKARISGEPEPFEGVISPQTPSFAELRDIFAANDAWFVDYVRSVPPAKLDEVVEFTFTDGDPGRMTRGEMLGHILTHGNSHRGAIGQMLGAIKVKGAPDMLTSYLSSAKRAG